MRLRLYQLVLVFLLAPILTATAQETDRPAELPAPADTLDVPAIDTLVAPLQPGENLPLDAGDEAPTSPAGTASSEGQLDEPVGFSAADSLVIFFSDTTGDVGSLFGQAGVTYGDAKLEAFRIDILFDIDELRASGLPSDTGLVGRPQFAQGSEAFAGNELAFNLRTERGRVVGARTNIQEGFIQAGVVKLAEDSTIYVADGAYTTCECEEDPSYTLRSDKMKIVDQEWIYTGPIQLYLFNIPTPLWLPFGFLPAREGRRSGPLPPRYGEDERGFYLRGWGWYQAINDYMDLQVEFGLWTLGSWQVAPLFRYAKRYAYRGQVGIDYGRSRSGESGDPNFQKYSTTSIRWSHNQEIDPSSSFNSNVNLSSRNYLRAVSEQYDDRVRQTIQSSIRYSKTWRGAGRNLGVDMNHRQLLSTGEVTATLPSLSFSQSARKPFDLESTSGNEERWFERITYSYNSSLDNRYAFDPLEADTLNARGDSAAVDISWLEAMFSPSRFRRATGDDAPFETTASHRISSSASFTINRLPIINRTFRLNVSPNFNYTEDWFLRTERRSIDPTTGVRVRRDVSDWLALRQFSAGVGTNTTFYGLFPLRVGPFRGLRHTVRPSLSFSYRPDFFDPFWGYTDTFTRADGEAERYAIVTGVQRGLQKAVSFSVNNVFETKRFRPDTTNQQTAASPTIQLLNLDFNSSYNIAADSFKLAPLRLSARTRLLDKVDLRASSTFSPYALNEAGSREVDRFLFQDSRFALARLTQLNVSLNTSFRSSQSNTSRPFTAGPRAQETALPLDFLGDPALGPGDLFQTPYSNSSLGYVDFAIPWSLTISMTYNFFRNFQGVLEDRRLEADFNAIVNTDFDFNLTPNWKLQGRTGYDFKQQELVYTSLSILRDFECWEMSVNWVPFGPYQSYSFDLHVKSGHLRDLLRIRQPRSDVQGRFGGLTQ